MRLLDRRRLKNKRRLNGPGGEAMGRRGKQAWVKRNAELAETVREAYAGGGLTLRATASRFGLPVNLVRDLLHEYHLLRHTRSKGGFYPEDPPRFLALAVVCEAVVRWRALRQRAGSPERQALLDFFADPLFQFWCDLGDLDAEAVVEHNRIPVETWTRTVRKRSLDNTHAVGYNGLAQRPCSIGALPS